MTASLLAVIYLSYVSLGLPDTLLGAAWPSLRRDLGAPLDAGGFISLTVSLCTVISSLLGNRIVRRLGTGGAAFGSVLLTALGLWGTSCAKSFLGLMCMAIPLGLGAGAVDAGLNNFVSLHCKPRHMSFLHCFWGLGAMGGPLIMAFSIDSGGSWTLGYRVVAAVQFVLVFLLGLSLPLWKRASAADPDKEEAKGKGSPKVLRLPGVKPVLLAFFCGCSLETGTGLWCASYLGERRGVTPGEAAGYSTLFYGGIALGRLLSGLLSEKLGEKALIRLGQGVSALGAILLVLPLSAALWGLFLLGLGCAPLYPAMLQATPRRFGRELSQKVMGLQLAAAYTGSTLLPTLLGAVAQRAGLNIFPWFLLLSLGLMCLSSERVNRVLERERKSSLK